MRTLPGESSDHNPSPARTSHANIRASMRSANVNEILLGKSVPGAANIFLHAQFGNRHGMIAGATGTGKSVSLMVLAEGFSRLGVPVFLALRGVLGSILK